MAAHFRVVNPRLAANFNYTFDTYMNDVKKRNIIQRPSMRCGSITLKKGDAVKESESYEK